MNELLSINDLFLGMEVFHSVSQDTGIISYLDIDNKYCEVKWDDGRTFPCYTFYLLKHIYRNQNCIICNKPAPHADPNQENKQYMCVACKTERDLSKTM